MYNLGQIATSDYSLLGAISEDELMGALERATMAERKQFVRRIQTTQKAVATATAPNNSRGEFEKRLHMLPADIRQGLANKTLQAVDATFYIVKPVGGNRVVKMLKDDDNKVVGISNISSAKLEKGNIMLLAGIILIGGVGEGADDGKGVNYDVLTSIIRNGEFELKANGTTIIPPTSCEVFDTTGTNRRRGLFMLDNPKIINDQQPIEMNIEWGVNAPERTFLKVMLIGTSVTKY
jgi:hypothetical protein